MAKPSTNLNPSPDVSLQQALEQLPPIALPEPPGFWPPAPGWWILGVMVIAGFVIVSLYAYYRYRAYAACRMLSRELTALKNAHVNDNDNDLIPFLMATAQLLRRFTLTLPRHRHLAAYPLKTFLNELNALSKNPVIDQRCIDLLQSYYLPPERQRSNNGDAMEHMLATLAKWLDGIERQHLNLPAIFSKRKESCSV